MIAIASLTDDGKNSEKSVILIDQKDHGQAKGGGGGRTTAPPPQYATESMHYINSLVVSPPMDQTIPHQPASPIAQKTLYIWRKRCFEWFNVQGKVYRGCYPLNTLKLLVHYTWENPAKMKK
jgi:hypothetical protein